MRMFEGASELAQKTLDIKFSTQSRIVYPRRHGGGVSAGVIY